VQPTNRQAIPPVALIVKKQKNRARIPKAMTLSLQEMSDRFEIQDLLIHSDHSVNQIAFDLNFSEPNHLMRFFKTQTGKTISAFIQESK
jgi:transcriptional regulator GlxA family with amidase domain